MIYGGGRQESAHPRGMPLDHTRGSTSSVKLNQWALLESANGCHKSTTVQHVLDILRRLDG
jgi:hypothetical protein